MQMPDTAADVTTAEQIAQAELDEARATSAKKKNEILFLKLQLISLKYEALEKESLMTPAEKKQKLFRGLKARYYPELTTPNGAIKHMVEFYKNAPFEQFVHYLPDPQERMIKISQGENGHHVWIHEVKYNMIMGSSKAAPAKFCALMGAILKREAVPFLTTKGCDQWAAIKAEVIQDLLVRVVPAGTEDEAQAKASCENMLANNLSLINLKLLNLDKD